MSSQAIKRINDAGVMREAANVLTSGLVDLGRATLPLAAWLNQVANRNDFQHASGKRPTTVHEFNDAYHAFCISLAIIDTREDKGLLVQQPGDEGGHK
jgi:hypothetical protein